VCVGTSYHFAPNLFGYTNVGSVDGTAGYFVETVVPDGSGSDNGVVSLFGQSGRSFFVCVGPNSEFGNKPCNSLDITIEIFIT